MHTKRTCQQPPTDVCTSSLLHGALAAPSSASNASHTMASMTSCPGCPGSKGRQASAGLQRRRGTSDAASGSNIPAAAMAASIAMTADGGHRVRGMAGKHTGGAEGGAGAGGTAATLCKCGEKEL